MKKPLYFVTATAVCLPLVTQTSHAQPILGNGGIIRTPILIPAANLTVKEAPSSQFNPRQTINSAKIKPNFQIHEGIKLGIASSKLVKDYADELEAKLAGKSVGYAFVVRYRDTSISAERAGGVARRAPDPSPRAMSVDERLNIASVSKTITAATLLKLLAKNNKSVDVKAYTLLPPDWTIGPNFNTVSVRELLTHYSGVRFPSEVTLQNLKSGVATGIKLSDKPVYEYNNSNFGLMRVIIARLYNPGLAPIAAAAPAVYGNVYMNAVANEVFNPAGLSGIECKPVAGYSALCYQFVNPKVAGTNFGDMSETNASRGWNMSARQLSTFGSKLFFSGKIMSQPQADTMIKDDLGIYGGMLTSTVADFGHSGYYPGKNEQGALYNAGELNSVLYGFSNGITVALLVNSQYGPGLSPTTAVRQAMLSTLAKS